ncbi:MAG: hypothetical protein WCC25_18265 [Candidatus Korobacteraceae bacterium]
MNRTRGLKHSGFAVGLIVLVAGMGLAQSRPTQGMIDVPFEFYISGVKLPAGQYLLDRVAPTYVLLRSKDGTTQQDLYLLQTAVPSKTPPLKVIFALRDGKYYFSEIWSWYGKSQLSSFSPQSGDQTKEVPLKAVEKGVAKPGGSL